LLSLDSQFKMYRLVVMKKRGLLTNYLLLVLFAYPLFFFPLLRDIFILGKSFFLIGAVFVGLILWLLTLWQEKEVRIYFARFEGILLILSLFLGGYLFFLSRGSRFLVFVCFFFSSWSNGTSPETKETISCFGFFRGSGCFGDDCSFHSS